MARAKASDPQRKQKPSVADELNQGIAKLRELSSQIDDLSRDGFPYREAGRARTELSLRETIRRLFGEKSPEYQAHKHHKLRVGSRAESAQSAALIKQLIAELEFQKEAILGLTSVTPAPIPPTISEKPALTAVPPSSSPESSVPSTAAVASPSAPLTVSGAMASNLSSPNQAIAPVIMTSPPSMNPGPTDTAPVEFSRPVHHASIPRQRLPSLPHSRATQSVRTPGALDEKKFVLATSPELPDTSTPPAQNSVVASSNTVEQLSTTTAVIQTGASDRPVIPQHTVPPAVPAASQLQTEPLVSVRSAPTAAIFLVSTPMPILSPSPASTGHLEPALIEEPPQSSGRASASQSTTEALPTEPLAASAPMAPESLRSAAELSVTLHAVEVPSKTPTQNNEKETGTLEMLRRICARFHLVARQLRLRKEYRPTIEITDEYDLQDLFYALLRLQFDEVGTEEWAPDYANGARRTSYLLDWDRIVVVVKQTRSGIGTKDLSEQVKSDATHYATRPNGITLVCFIYDPEGRVGNPRGLEADLTSISDTYMVEVIIAPK
jgi:hypothetical protein